ncbi:DUF547 domain-containing protein [Alkalimarinus coralli]|uniref:DUF547 domain-containing protein n=1 Tax=Alkalimarinus coralli TaxID=2935863 RepID=UPI00202B93E0|nr:DUF547 domain-containing protein [Alkalimarinus coralli]
MAKISLFTILTLCIVFSAQSAPKADLWVYWDASNEGSVETISHKAWERFLVKYASFVEPSSETRLVDYSSVTRSDHRELKGYILTLSQLDPRDFNRNEQFAYWVNLYNSTTIDLILDNYPTTSITKLGGFFSFGPWDQDIITIAGKRISLNDIEHRILRPIWNDNRIHYVVNCASIGCPNLPLSPISSLNLNEQLDSAAKEFINSDKALRFYGDKLILSKIYDWYSVDFGSFQELKTHLSHYLDKSKATVLKSFQGDVDYEYDWQLNDTN